MSTEPVAGSLAQLLKQRTRVAQSFSKKAPPADTAGQFGLFDAAVPEPAPSVREASVAPELPVSAAPIAVPVPDAVVSPASAAMPAVRAVAVETAATMPSGAVVSRAVVADSPDRKMVLPERETALPARAADGAPWTVSALVSTLRGQLEAHGPVWVAGEISNLRPAQSGHLYFTLKDGDAQIGAVLFRRQAALLGWRPSDGAAVLLRGRVSIFEGRGQLQLIAETMELRGAGLLQARFEQLKAKLRAEGLFEAGRKRALPAFPRRIGVVTSLQGAVIRDIVTVCRRRHGCLNLLVYPAAVQGVSAAAEVAAGIRYFNHVTERSGGLHDARAVDLIVIARGGGSAEDLQAFNDEALARTIAASGLPVVSAVGHETDFTIADFVADLRAPTPSAAAEMMTETQHRVEERVEQLRSRLVRAVRFQGMTARQRLMRVAAEGVLRRTVDALHRREQRLDLLRERLERAALAGVARLRRRSELLEGGLQRGDVRERLRRSRVVLQAAEGRLWRAGAGLPLPGENRLGRLHARLEALSPLRVLERGYSLTFLADGSLVRSAAQVSSGDAVVLRFAAGGAAARVEDVHGGAS